VSALDTSDRDEGVVGQLEVTSDPPRPAPTTALAFFAFAAIVVAYFAFIHHYAVNSIFYDQWFDIRLLGHWYSGTLTLSDLWAQHGYNRILFPNLIVLLLARSVHYDTVVEQYLSGALLVASTALIIWAHKRRSPTISWLWYVPVGAVLLSFVQYVNTLWGFQLAWYMVYISLALSLFFLDRPHLTWPRVGFAIAVAVVGSYSSAQGLLIWPIGFLLLYQRNRPRSMKLTWLGSAIVTGVVYFYNLNLPGNSSYLFTHPIAAAKYYFLTVGGVLGIQVPQKTDAETYAVIAFGFVIFVLACWVLVTFAGRRDEITGAPVGVALTAFGLVFAAMATSERVSNGFFNQTYTEYTTFALLIPVGCGLTLLSAWTNATHQRDSATAPSVRYHMGLRATTLILGMVIALQLLLGTGNGLTNAGDSTSYMRLVASATVNGSKSTEPYDVKILLLGCPCPQLNLPQLIQIAREHRLSTFGAGDVAMYLKEGLPRETVPPKTWVINPLSGSTLHRGVVLSAGATTDEYSVSKVDLVLSGGGFDHVTIAKAGPTDFGWLAAWNTATVPNGSYLLQSVAYDAMGKSGRSQSVRIQVANP
jgi:hypothetical protein